MSTTRREWLSRWFGVKRLNENVSRDLRYPEISTILHRQKYGYKVPVQAEGYTNLNEPVPAIEDEDAIWSEEVEDEK
jgi:hypothetical protein